MKLQTNIKGLTFDELKEGKEYEIYSVQFDVYNKARLICFDTTVLKRRIAYFQFIERGYKPISKNELTLMFIQDRYPHTVFALWDHDLKDNNIVTEIHTGLLETIN